MPVDVHILEMQDVSGANAANGSASANPVRTDRVMVASWSGVASNATGSTTTATVAFTGLNLPSDYVVEVTPSAACIASVSSKTSAGFTVTLTGNGTGDVPASTLFDVLVWA